MRSAFAAFTSAVILLACFAKCDGEPTAGIRALSITNGELEPGYPAVNEVVFSLSGGAAPDGACSGVLVGARTVLTTAHCLGYPNTGFKIGDLIYRSTRTVIHPDFDRATPELYDLGLVIIDPAPPLDPMAITPALPIVGKQVTLVGLGETTRDAKDNHIRRSALNEIDEVTPLNFSVSGTSETYGNACYGDSGGPVLLDSRQGPAVHGLLSYITGACGPSTTLITRLDIFIGWLRREAGADIQILDITRPSVAFDELLDGSIVEPELTLSATASDNTGVASVTLLIDGEEQASLETAPYSFEVSLSPGKHELELVARDPADNSGIARITVTVPTLSPSDRGIAADVGATTDLGVSDTLAASGGCSTGAAHERSGHTWMAVLLLLGWGTRGLRKPRKLRDRPHAMFAAWAATMTMSLWTPGRTR